jgi:hypothetical protein
MRQDRSFVEISFATLLTDINVAFTPEIATSAALAAGVVSLI